MRVKPFQYALMFGIAAHLAYGYEYTLQFTPASGARNLLVAGYQFNGSLVVGNCSYDTVSVTSGRDPRSITTHHYNTCNWDLFGNLTSLTPVSAPMTAPAVLSVTGTETIYAISGASSTGRDSRGFGFVATPSSHYTWTTPSGGYATIPWAPLYFSVILASDGDNPLNVSSATATPSVSGTITPSPGKAYVVGSTCTGSIAPGSYCGLEILYNPKAISCTASPYGYAYTKIAVELVSDAGNVTDWTYGFTITGVPICND